MTSTQQVLRALQRSHTAKRNIRANTPPVDIEPVRLPDQGAKPPQKDYAWASLQCSHVAFSSCGRWAAACLKGEQRCTLNLPARQQARLPASVSAYELVLYSTTSAFEQQASFCTGSSMPAVAWTQAAGHLCIAQQPRCRRQISLDGKVWRDVHQACCSSAQMLVRALVQTVCAGGG